MVIPLAVVQPLHLGVRVSGTNTNMTLEVYLLQPDQTAQHHVSLDDIHVQRRIYSGSESNFNEPEKQAVRIYIQLFAEITGMRSGQINQLFGKY